MAEVIAPAPRGFRRCVETFVSIGQPWGANLLAFSAKSAASFASLTRIVRAQSLTGEDDRGQ